MKLQKIEQEKAQEKLENTSKAVVSTTWMERAYSKTARYASAKVYTK